MKKYLSLLLALVFIILSCSKSKEPAPAPAPVVTDPKFVIKDSDGNELFKDNTSTLKFSKFVDLLKAVNSKDISKRRLNISYIDIDTLILTNDSGAPLSQTYENDYGEAERALIEGFNGQILLDTGKRLSFDQTIDQINMKNLFVAGNLTVENGKNVINLEGVYSLILNDGILHLNHNRLINLDINEVVLNNGSLYLHGSEANDIHIRSFIYNGGIFDAFVDNSQVQITSLKVSGDHFQAHSDLLVESAEILEGGVLTVSNNEIVNKVVVNAGGRLEVNLGKVLEAFLKENGLIQMNGAHNVGDVKYHSEGGRVEGNYAGYAVKLNPSFKVLNADDETIYEENSNILKFSKFMELLRSVNNKVIDKKKLTFIISDYDNITLSTDDGELLSDILYALDEDNRTLIENFDGKLVFEEGKKFIFDETIDRLYMEKLIIEGHLVVIRSGSGEGNEIKIGSLTGLTLNEGYIHIDPREIYGINIKELILNGGRLFLHTYYDNFNHKVQSCIYNGGIFDTWPLFNDVIIKNIIINGNLDIFFYFQFENVTIKNGGELIFSYYINKLFIENGGKFNMNGGRVAEAWLKKGGVASINYDIGRWDFRYHDEGGILEGEYAYLAEKIED